MKTSFTILLILIALTIAQAQTDQAECFYAKYDRAAKSTYRPLRIDTLINYQDGDKVFAFLKISQFRNDTVVTVDSVRYRVNADTIVEFVDPDYQRIDIPISPAIIDTLIDPEDKTRILDIDTIRSISVRYAHIYTLDLDSFFQVIQAVRSNAERQSISIQEVVVTFYNKPKSLLTLELIDKKDFDDVEFAKANFLLEKNGEMMTYPIVFKKE